MFDTFFPRINFGLTLSYSCTIILIWLLIVLCQIRMCVGFFHGRIVVQVWCFWCRVFYIPCMWFGTQHFLHVIWYTAFLSCDLIHSISSQTQVGVWDGAVVLVHLLSEVCWARACPSVQILWGGWLENLLVKSVSRLIVHFLFLETIFHCYKL